MLALLGASGQAAELALPTGARESGQQTSALDDYALPIGPWADGFLPTRPLQGQVRKTAWRLEGAGATTLQLIQPLRAQLVAQDFQILFDCADRACGGFDFRFTTEVLPAPAMYVDLSDYRFVSAISADGSEALSILVSQNAAARFVQVIRVVPQGVAMPTVATNAPPVRAAPVGDLAVALERDGGVVLSDLTFATGSSDLGDGPFQTLQDLAAYLLGDPARRVVLVGHSDGIGSAEGNLALSKRRSASVRTRLINAWDVPSAQVTSGGVGFLSPLATNLTEEGRLLNRRVEAVVLPQ